MNVFIENYHEYVLSRSIVIQSMVTAFEIVYDVDFYYAGESHNFWEFVCVIDGKVGVTADNKVYELEKNQIILHKPKEFHRLWSASSTRPHLIIMSFKTEKPLPMGEYLYKLSDSNLRLIQELMKTAEEIFKRDEICIVSHQKGKEADVQIFINNLEIFLLNVLKSSTAFNLNNQSQSAINYSHIVDVLKMNLDKNLSVDEIAVLCNMSKSNLKKTFEKYAGEGIMKHFNSLKIQKAITMLNEGMSIGEVSRSLGFAEQNYFSTVFKRLTGYSPSKFRGIY